MKQVFIDIKHSKNVLTITKYNLLFLIIPKHLIKIKKTINVYTLSNLKKLRVKNKIY